MVRSAEAHCSQKQKASDQIHGSKTVETIQTIQDSLRMKLVVNESLVGAFITNYLIYGSIGHMVWADSRPECVVLESTLYLRRSPLEVNKMFDNASHLFLDQSTKNKQMTFFF